jgi:thiamine-phosphate diphosphorylase
VTGIGGLYVIIDPAACRGRALSDVAARAIEGGARVIQWRDKTRDKGDQLADARAVRNACADEGVPFIVNDHADLALALDADGVHLGQHDLPIAVVRPFFHGTIGVSTNNADEAVAAQDDGADYVAVGAIFPTASKDTTRPADLQRISDVKAAVQVPVVAIGGINSANIASVVAAGADAAAVISAVCSADDVRAAAAELAAAFAQTV